MGSFLGKSGASASPARAHVDSPERPSIRRPGPRLCHVQRVQHIHRAFPIPRRRPARRPPNWDPAHPPRVVNEAWRRFPMTRVQNSVMGPLPSDWWESYLKRTIWSLRHPRAVWSPVTVKISPPEQRAPSSVSSAGVIASAGPSEEPPDPRAKETVLRALRECRKERARIQEPPLPESSDAERSRETRPSAFKPLAKRCAGASFVPRPGPLKRSLHSWSSGHSLKGAGGSSAESSSAGKRTRGPLCAKRNAISSSYSSSRDFAEPWKRSFPSTSVWPMKRKGKGHQSLSLCPVVSDTGSPGGPGSCGQHSLKVPLLLTSPGNLLPTNSAPQLGCAVSGEALILGKNPGLKCSDKPRKETPSVQPSLSFTVSASATAATASTKPQLEILKKMHMSPGPLAFPQSAGEGTDVVHCSQNTPSLLTPPGHSHSEPPPVASSDAKHTAPFNLPTPAFPTTSATDTTRPPSTPQADRSAMSPDPPVITPTAPTMQSTRFGVMSSPTLFLPSGPTAVASVYPILRPTLGPLHNSEVAGSLNPRISDPSEPSSSSSFLITPGDLTRTFKPIFGSTGPLKTMPVRAPSPHKQLSTPCGPVSSPVFHDLAMATPVLRSTPANTSMYRPPLDLSTTGDASSVLASCNNFLVGAQAFRASSSPATSFIFSSHQHPVIPSVHTVTVFSHVFPSVIQILPCRGPDSFRDVSAPALLCTNQPALSPSISNLTPAFTIPLRPSSRPSVLLSPGATPQPAFGAIGGQKPALSPSFSNSFLFGNPAVASPMPVPGPDESAFGVETPAAPTLHMSASMQPGMGSTPGGLPWGPVSPTDSGVVTCNHASGAQGTVFGSTAPRPFAFGGLVTPMDCGEPGVLVTAPGMGSTFGAASVNAELNEATSPVTPFGEGWSLPSQNTPFSLGKASFSTKKIMSFAQRTPITGPFKVGSHLGFGLGLSCPSCWDSMGRDAFKPSATSFSIGARPKPLRNQEQGHSRRHHAHKK